ncbi:MAG: ABC transporter permease [Bacteroidota bacterium]
MFKHYFITAIRNILNNASHSLLNVLGLSVGLACCTVVFTIVNFEYSFDKWHKNKENIYRVTTIYHGDNRIGYSGIIPYPTGEILDEIPEIEDVVLFHGPSDGKLSFVANDGSQQIYREEQVLMTNQSFFSVLDFKLLSGDPASLDEPFNIILSKELAIKYFENEDPIGKIIFLNGETELKVSGIIENSPNNTNLPYDCLISFKTLKKIYPGLWNQWGMTWAHSIYLKLRADADIQALNIKIDERKDINSTDEEEDSKKTQIALQPLTEIHTDEKYGDGYHYVTPSLIIWAFIFLGGLILGTACLNFINLNTAIAIKRSKEVGIRKTLGSSKKQLIIQFLSETLVIVTISMMLAVSIGQYLITQFNQLITTIEYNLHYANDILLFGTVMVVFITILAGFYPSMVLSGYQPVEALKNKINLKAGTGNFNLRRSLVVAQFVFTSILIIGTLIISAQVNFMKSKNLGFDPSNVVKIQAPPESKMDVKVLLAAYQSKNFVEDATLSFTSPMDWNNWNNSYSLKGEEYIDGNNANMKFVDANYMNFYEIPLITGQQLSERTINDTTFKVVVTQKLLETLGINDPTKGIGRMLVSGRNQFEIIGVAKDFSVSTLHDKIRPVILSYRPGKMNQIALRLSDSDINRHIIDIEDTFREIYPNELFEMAVFENEISEQYMLEDLLHKVIRFVSILAILLSIMGLYGLVSFMANRNAKVIGIRKVFGASTGNILRIFTKEYTKLLLISFLISAPTAYFLMNTWIQEFAFRIEITAKYFIIGFLIATVIAIVTVGYRSLIAATANPIRSLRYE